jgi:hypothetical protein
VAKRYRAIGSLKRELVMKSQEAALTAVKVFNDPLVKFKSETFIVLMVIAWTYLLHAYYRSQRIEYRYYVQKEGQKRRKFDRIKAGRIKYWELERCVNEPKCPLDRDTSNNLRFLIGLRHEIEHQMTLALDSYLSARYQACLLNYADYVKQLFGPKFGIDQHLTYAIQLAELTKGQTDQLAAPRIPPRLQAFIQEFDGKLSAEEYSSARYAYRLLFTPKLVNRPGQADRVIEFLKPDSELAKAIGKEYWVKKEVERPKLRAKAVVERVKAAGFSSFRVQREHVDMWRAEDAKNPAKGYGVEVEGTWYWYESWVERCISLCGAAGEKYR